MHQPNETTVVLLPNAVARIKVMQLPGEEKFLMILEFFGKDHTDTTDHSVSIQSPVIFYDPESAITYGCEAVMELGFDLWFPEGFKTGEFECYFFKRGEYKRKMVFVNPERIIKYREITHAESATLH